MPIPLPSIAKQEKDHSPLTWTARIVSLIAHPLWMPLVFASWKHWGDPGLPTLLIVISIFLIGFPGLVSLLWMWARVESDWFVMSQANRMVPLISGLIGMAFFAVANGAILPDALFQGELMSILILLLFISIIVTLFWKISIHMLSWGAVNAFTFAYALQGGSWLIFALTLLLSLGVAWARMRVKSHDWLQIVVGWGAGVAAAVVIVMAFPWK